MRKPVITFILILFGCTFSAFSQDYSASASSTNITSSLTDFSLDLEGDWSTTTSFTIERTLVFGTDSTLVYQGSYNLSEADAGAFVSFIKDETTKHIILGLGAFEAFTSGAYLTTIRFVKTNQEEQILSLNQ